MNRALPSTVPASTYERLQRHVFARVTARLRRYADLAEERLSELRLRHEGCGRARTIPTWTSKVELEALYRLASGCPRDASIVEIGSYLGASTCFLGAGAAANGAKITCIDTWKNETMPDGKRDTFAEFQRNTAGLDDRISVVRKASADVLPEDLPASIDLAFIDADHSYEATKTDLALVLPRMAPEGIIAFHDTATFAGVSRVLSEILAGSEWCLAGHLVNLTWIRRATWSPWPPAGAGA